MMRPPPPGFIQRPQWARVSPFPSGLLVPPRHGAEPIQLLVLGLMVCAGAIVLLDVLYSALSILAVGLFALFGLRIDRSNMPLIFMLVTLNLAGLVAAQPYLHDKLGMEYVIGTNFVAVTAIFFCLAMNENALSRLGAIKWGLIIGAEIASLAAIAGYFDLGGTRAIFTMNEGRASGTFRDANVLGSFLVLPALMLINDLMRRQGFQPLRLMLLGVIILAIFLTFSRGSWAAFVIGTGVLIALTFLTSGEERMRGRILLFGMVGFTLFAILLVGLLSVSNIAEVFADRFTLQKDYDSGPSGRFGNQLRSLPHLLSLPFGYGPLQFAHFYPEDPHNAYISAFSNYGWVGGIAYLTFIITTTIVGARACFQRTPFQPFAIVIFAALIPHLVQNFQIDTDRWRHLFMIYGLTWGLATASRRWGDEYRAYAHQAYRAQVLIVQPRIQPAE